MTSHTIQLRRVLRVPPERAYRAFLDPDAISKWLPPRGFHREGSRAAIRTPAIALNAAFDNNP